MDRSVVCGYVDHKILVDADSIIGALEIAQDTVGPSATYMHIPSLFICEVS
jgi:hypothetical protein